MKSNILKLLVLVGVIIMLTFAPSIEGRSRSKSKSKSGGGGRGILSKIFGSSSTSSHKSSWTSHRNRHSSVTESSYHSPETSTVPERIEWETTTRYVPRYVPTYSFQEERRRMEESQKFINSLNFG